MSTSGTTTAAPIFELVRFVDGRPVPYRPYTGGCTSCCGAELAAAAPTRSCCH